MFSTMANFKGTHTPMHVLKSGERKDNEILDCISELISNIDLPEIWKYV